MSREAAIIVGVFVAYIAGIFLLNRRCRTFMNDADGVSSAEFAALAVLPLYLYVGVSLAIAGGKITDAQVDFFGVLSWPIIAVVANEAVRRFGFPGKRGSASNGGGAWGGGGFDGGFYGGQFPPPMQTEREGGKDVEGDS